MPRITIGGYSFTYNHSHDVLGIIETVIFDSYKSSKLPEGSTVIDIGAGVGDFTVVASRRIGASGTVVAIEPNPEDFACLLNNIEVNNCKNVIPVQSAVSDHEEDVELTFKNRTTVCRARRLRDVLHSIGLDSRTVGFVKIDIEGNERVVVPDNIDILKQCHRVAVELHNGADLVLHPLMADAGFSFRRMAKQDYLAATARFCFWHPIQSVLVYAVARRAQEYHGVRKLFRGLEITNSKELVVGEYLSAVQR